MTIAHWLKWPPYLRTMTQPIDFTQHQDFQDKRNPFHDRFTQKNVTFWCANRMNI